MNQIAELIKNHDHSNMIVLTDKSHSIFDSYLKDSSLLKIVTKTSCAISSASSLLAE